MCIYKLIGHLLSAQNIVLPDSYSSIHNSPIIIDFHLQHLIDELLRYLLHLKDLAVDPVHIFVSALYVELLLLGKDEIISCRHPDGLNCVRNELNDAVLAEIWDEDAHIPQHLARG